MALLETNCSSDAEELAWAAEWGDQAFWASQYRDPALQSLASHRGVAILLRGDAFGSGNVLARDPDGRFLIVLVPIYYHPTLIIAFHADCGPTHAESVSRLQRAFAALTLAPGTDIHLLADTNICPAPIDHHRFGPPSNHPGARVDDPAALGQLTSALGGLTDAFRSLHPSAAEFTFTNRSHGTVISKSRLDHHYIRPNLLSGSAPRLVSVSHLSPSCYALQRIRGSSSHVSQCGDHAAVRSVIAYSDTPRPPSTWHLPLHLLRSASPVNALRAIVDTSLTRHENRDPCLRMRTMLADVRKWARERDAADGKEHRSRRDALLRELYLCDSTLGEGVDASFHIQSEPDPVLRAARHADFTRRRDASLASLSDMKAAEDRRWLLDHNYDADIHSETCRRDFFARMRALERADSFMPAVSVAPDRPDLPHRTVRSQRDVNTAADRFYGSVPGGLFNLPFTPDTQAEDTLFSALRDDGKTLPAAHAEPLASFDAIVNFDTVSAAISGLSLGSVPGCDGFPTEFFRLFVLKPPRGTDPDDDDAPGAAERKRARRVITLLVDVFREIADARAFPPDWNISITSLIHKKGPRTLLSNYRPISVCPILYKILARCLADALQHALPWVIDASQVACQQGRSCFSNCRYVQDLIHYADCSNLPGVLVFADAIKAFDRVQHCFLLRTLDAMHIPAAFSSLFRVLLAGATTRVKINGFLGRPIALRNGVRQGDPCAALAYLISVQPYLSLVACASRAPRSIPLADGTLISVKLEGIPLPPNADGTPAPAHIAVAMADDVAAALRDTFQLPGLHALMCVHERASGSLNSWLKTFGLRVGSLRGSTAMPPDWDPLHVDFSTDVIRYLGIFTGTPSAVLAKWMLPRGTQNASDLSSRIEHRLSLWSSLGVGPTYAGRNLIVKNSALAMAWFLAEAQTLPEIDAVLTRWQRSAWSFIESSLTSLRSMPLDSPIPSAHHVARVTLVQDYPEGGRRCVDVELFVRSLRARAVRTLFEPGNHPYRALALHWLRISYPDFPHHPSALLLSNCDLSHLHPDTPQFWREVFSAWGTLGNGLSPSTPPFPSTVPLQPTYQLCRPLPPFDDSVWHRPAPRRVGTSAELHLSVLLSLPIAHNPLLSGCFGAPVRDPPDLTRSAAAHDRASHVRLIRTRSADCIAASNELHHRLSRLAQRGITHLFHLISPPSPGQPMRYLTPADLSRAGLDPASRNGSLPHWVCSELIAALPPTLIAAFDAAISLSAAHRCLTLRALCNCIPFPAESWVRHCTTRAFHQIQGHVTRPPPLSVLYDLGPAFAQRPDGRLLLLPSDHPNHYFSVRSSRNPTRVPVPASHLLLSTVWLTTRVAHCQERRDADDRDPDDPDTPERALLHGGPAVDLRLLFGDRHAPPASLNPTLFSLIPHPTDRHPPPTPVATCDVFSLYHLQLSFRHSIPRTLDTTLAPSSTSTSHAHLLDVQGETLETVRKSICNASHPDPSHGFLTSHALYMTTHDARPLGNERCLKCGPTRSHCDICHHVDRVSRRELSSHVLSDCPYSRLLLDPILRSLLPLYCDSPADRNHWLTSPSDLLLDSCALLLRTGSPIGCPVSIPEPVASNVAGCISLVLFTRASMNAPRLSSRPCPHAAVCIRLAGAPAFRRSPTTPPPDPPDNPLSFCASRAYSRFIHLLSQRLSHTHRHALALDDNLTVLHPGIEPWLLEHGHEAEWHTHWDALCGPNLGLSLPSCIDDAPVGCTGALGTSHLPLLVLPRLFVRPSIRNQPARVHLRLSIGRRVGSSAHDHDNAAPSDAAWPLPAGSTPEYAVDCIVDESRTSLHGLRYCVKWLHHADHFTWEPAASLASTAALDTWLLRPRGALTVALRGDPAALSSLLAIPDLRPSRARNLRSLLASMDAHGVIGLEPRKPAAASTVLGGRTTFVDSRGVGNVFLTCHADSRAFAFGMYWDEIDISRSHVSAVFGCWTLTRRPRPVSLLRFRSEQAQFESDIAAELAAARPHREHDLSTLYALSGGVPSRALSQRIIYARKALAKCSMKPKQIMSAMINSRNTNSWRIPFDPYPTLMQLLTDINLMRPAVLLHPLCTAYAAALAADGVHQLRAISLCLGHLDDATLTAAATALRQSGCLLGPTINDSQLILKRAPIDPPTILQRAIDAASASLLFPVTFAFLPGLLKPDDPRPTMASLATALAAPSRPQDDADSDDSADDSSDDGSERDTREPRAPDDSVRSPSLSPSRSPSFSPSHSRSDPSSPNPDPADDDWNNEAALAPTPPPPSPVRSPSFSPSRSPSFSPSHSRSDPSSPNPDPADDDWNNEDALAPTPPPPSPARSPLHPEAQTTHATRSLRPIGLAHSDPHLASLVNFPARGQSHLAHFFRRRAAPYSAAAPPPLPILNAAPALPPGIPSPPPPARHVHRHHHQCQSPRVTRPPPAARPRQPPVHRPTPVRPPPPRFHLHPPTHLPMNSRRPLPPLVRATLPSPLLPDCTLPSLSPSLHPPSLPSPPSPGRESAGTGIDSAVDTSSRHGAMRSLSQWALTLLKRAYEWCLRLREAVT